MTYEIAYIMNEMLYLLGEEGLKTLSSLHNISGLTVNIGQNVCFIINGTTLKGVAIQHFL